MLIPTLDYAQKLTNQFIQGSAEDRQAIAKLMFDEQLAVLEAAAKFRGRVYDPKKSKGVAFSRILN